MKSRLRRDSRHIIAPEHELHTWGCAIRYRGNSSTLQMWWLSPRGWEAAPSTAETLLAEGCSIAKVCRIAVASSQRIRIL